MPTPDPIAALMAVAKDTPDPRAISNWLTAYLGTRPHDAKLVALTTFEQAFDRRLGNESELRAATMVLAMIRRMRDQLSGDGQRKGGKKARRK